MTDQNGTPGDGLAAAQKAFAALDPECQARVLALWAHDLTIRARGSYPGVDTQAGNLAALQAVNECQHTILSHLAAVIAGRADRYPDEVLIEALWSGSAYYPPSAHDVRAALARSLKMVRPQTATAAEGI